MIMFTVRSYKEDMKYINRTTPYKFNIAKGFVPNMKVLLIHAVLEVHDKISSGSRNVLRQ